MQMITLKGDKVKKRMLIEEIYYMLWLSQIEVCVAHLVKVDLREKPWPCFGHGYGFFKKHLVFPC